MEEAPQQPAMVLAELAADQVERLDAVRTLVDLGDPGVADMLLDTGLADIAMAAKQLHGEVGGGEAMIGEERLDDGVSSAARSSAAWRCAGSGCRSARSSCKPTQYASALAPSVKALMVSRVPAHVGMDNDRIGRLDRRIGLRPVSGPAAAPWHRSAAVLVGGLSDGEAL